MRNINRAGEAAKWHSGEPPHGTEWSPPAPENGVARIYGNRPKQVVAPKFTLADRPRIFASGSCFAREIELALYNLGHDVLSWTPQWGGEYDGTFNRYTTHAIIGDFLFALEGGWSPENIVEFGGKFFDYTGHGAFETKERAIEVRERIISAHRKALEADVLFVTLGLVEAWYDTQIGVYCNTPPFGQFLGGRYELRITDFAENLGAMRRFISTLRKHKADLKIILTTSPVALKETFSGQDILIANTYSKAVLRAVAQEIAQNDPLTDYFPSYEMVTQADPDSAWEHDRRHVKRDFVAEIINRFISAYMPS